MHEFATNGEAQPMLIATTKSGPFYINDSPSCSENGQTFRARQASRTITPMRDDRLLFGVPQIARNVHIGVDYTDIEIAKMRVSDLTGTTHANHPPPPSIFFASLSTSSINTECC